MDGGQAAQLVEVISAIEPDDRSALIDHGAWVAGVAQQSTPDELRRYLTAEMRRWQADDDTSRLERQRRACRLRHGIDDEGMWWFHGRFDPETAVRLDRRFADTVHALFGERVPEHCPDDPRERQEFLRAHALLALVDGRGPSAGRPAVIAVVDTTTPGGPTVDWGLPVELPTTTLVHLFVDAGADVSAVVVRDGAVLHAPGVLDLGRATRLASRAQRLALRAVYPSCAIPGCDIRYDRCKLHHVVWWEHGGTTDLDNLLPVCAGHHHDIHDCGWQLTLQRDRTLTITYPDGTRQIAPPPRRGPPRPQTRPSARQSPSPPSPLLPVEQPREVVRC